jgi:Fic family protein
LLITFFLIVRGDLKQPLLYLSLFFKNNRQEYYDRLSAVRQTGDWEGWMQFFLTGVAETADQVVETSHAISALFATDRTKLDTLKRAGISARQVHEFIRRKAITSATEAAKALAITVPTARAALNNLKELGIVRDVSGKGKERLYIYGGLIDILEKGTDPIAY